MNLIVSFKYLDRKYQYTIDAYDVVFIALDEWSYSVKETDNEVESIPIITNAKIYFYIYGELSWADKDHPIVCGSQMTVEVYENIRENNEPIATINEVEVLYG